MAQPYVGEIRMFAGNFAPLGWMLCQGQLVPISDNEVLFSLIGTTYGGDGQTTFALPDLRSRVPIHMGTGGGSYVLGQSGGVESVTLTNAQMPTHNHPVEIATSPGNASIPAGNTVLSSQFESSPNAAPVYAAVASPATNQSALAVQTVGAAGGNQPHTNIQPVLAVNYIISLFGIYPSQS